MTNRVERMALEVRNFIQLYYFDHKLYQICFLNNVTFMCNQIFKII
jgi:hypothetical protein